MDNIFGITQDDVDHFTPESEEFEDEDLDVEDFLSNVADIGNNLIEELNSPRWLAEAKLIARLPGLSDEVKVAAILLGSGSVLSQLLLLHMPVRETLSVQDGLKGFKVYCEMLGMPPHTVSEWIATYFSLGFLKQNPDKTTELGDLAIVAGNILWAGVNILWQELFVFKNTLEKNGIVFYHDTSLIPVPIESLAPDK